jgi:ABC transporter
VAVGEQTDIGLDPQAVSVHIRPGSPATRGDVADLGPLPWAQRLGYANHTGLLDSGAMRWGGRPVSAGERGQFGYMPEERGLYPRMRVREQLAYLGQLGGRPEAEAGRSVNQWLERLGLQLRGDDRLDKLSHGNQQRVQLIAALVNEPRLLVLDEPFSGLDPMAMASMSDLLAEVAGAGATVLFLQPPARSGGGHLRGRRDRRPRPSRPGR